MLSVIKEKNPWHIHELCTMIIVLFWIRDKLCPQLSQKKNGRIPKNPPFEWLHPPLILFSSLWWIFFYIVKNPCGILQSNVYFHFGKIWNSILGLKFSSISLQNLAFAIDYPFLNTHFKTDKFSRKKFSHLSKFEKKKPQQILTFSTRKHFLKLDILQTTKSEITFDAGKKKKTNHSHFTNDYLSGDRILVKKMNIFIIHQIWTGTYKTKLLLCHHFLNIYKKKKNKLLETMFKVENLEATQHRNKSCVA